MPPVPSPCHCATPFSPFPFIRSFSLLECPHSSPSSHPPPFSLPCPSSQLLSVFPSSCPTLFFSPLIPTPSAASSKLRTQAQRLLVHSTLRKKGGCQCMWGWGVEGGLGASLAWIGQDREAAGVRGERCRGVELPPLEPRPQRSVLGVGLPCPTSRKLYDRIR